MYENYRNAFACLTWESINTFEKHISVYVYEKKKKKKFLLTQSININSLDWLESALD